jgi:hypothetical protein
MKKTQIRFGAADQHLEEFKSRVWVVTGPESRLVEMESSMKRLSGRRARPRIGRALATAAALLCATALSQPNLAYAQMHGGGGGFHGGGGGFHGGGFHGGGFGGFHGGGFHRGFDGFHDGRFHGERFHGNRFFFGGSFASPWWGYYPDYGYYDYSQPYSSQTWYYCSDPAGYYPYVTQCNTGWQAVPAS